MSLVMISVFYAFVVVILVSYVSVLRMELGMFRKENAKLEEQLKRALSIQTLSVMYGPEEIKKVHTGASSSQKPESIKLRGRKTWPEIAEKLQYLTSPEAIMDGRMASREAVKKEIEEAVNG